MKEISIARQEYKYYISSKDSVILSSILNSVMEQDQYASDDGGYIVTSLYFDTFDGIDLDEKLDGLLDREKHRVRMYQRNTELMKLEIKRKTGFVIAKDSYTISGDEAKKLLMDGAIVSKEIEQMYSQFIYSYKAKGKSPNVIVEYDREAFNFSDFGVRITIDKNLRTFNTHTDLFDFESAVEIPVFTNEYQILEVKFNKEIPRFLLDILSSFSTSRSSISKYVLSLQYVDSCPFRDHLIKPF